MQSVRALVDSASGARAAHLPEVQARVMEPEARCEVKFIAVSRAAWMKMPLNAPFADVEASVNGTSVVAHEVEKKEVRCAPNTVMVYRGEGGIVEGLACLHMQGW